MDLNNILKYITFLVMGISPTVYADEAPKSTENQKGRIVYTATAIQFSYGLNMIGLEGDIPAVLDINNSIFDRIRQEAKTEQK